MSSLKIYPILFIAIFFDKKIRLGNLSNFFCCNFLQSKLWPRISCFLARGSCDDFLLMVLVMINVID